MALKSALRSYAVARELITPELDPLVLPQLKSIRESIAEAFGVPIDKSTKGSTKRRVRWEGKEMAEWVAGLTELVSRFEERVEKLLKACDKIDSQLRFLEEIEFDNKNFSNVVNCIQEHVDGLSLAGYSGLKSWVDTVNLKVGEILKHRLEDALIDWSRTLEEKKDERDDEEEKDIPDEKDEIYDYFNNVKIPAINVEILLRNQEISASPPTPNVRSLFLIELHSFISIVCSLPKVASERFEVFDSTSTADIEQSSNSFDYLLEDVQPSILADAYSCIEHQMSKVSLFVEKWLSYQTLWDTRVNDVANAVGDDLTLWHSLLNEAADARNALDSTMTICHFGPVCVKYDKVQSQINLKYDSWQKELQLYYSNVLGKIVFELHGHVCESKSKLENVSLDTTTSTQEIVLGVTFIQEMKGKIDLWRNDINVVTEAERLLKRQRHSFTSDWMEVSVVQGQFDHLEHILKKRSLTMEEQMPVLQARVTSEDKVAEQRIKELLSSWSDDRPLQGNISPQEAKEILSKFEFSAKKAKTDEENLLKAKDALGLEATISSRAVSDCYDEIMDLKEVWHSISTPYQSLDKIKESPWATSVARKIRKQLEDITAGT